MSFLVQISLATLALGVTGCASGQSSPQTPGDEPWRPTDTVETAGEVSLSSFELAGRVAWSGLRTVGLSTAALFSDGTDGAAHTWDSEVERMRDVAAVQAREVAAHARDEPPPDAMMSDAAKGSKKLPTPPTGPADPGSVPPSAAKSGNATQLPEGDDARDPGLQDEESFDPQPPSDDALDTEEPSEEPTDEGLGEEPTPNEQPPPDEELTDDDDGALG